MKNFIVKRMMSVAAAKVAALVVVCILSLLSSGSIFLRAQVIVRDSLVALNSDAVRISFPAGSATLNRQFLENRRAFAELDSLLDLKGQMFVDSILVVSKSSPDGGSALNNSLSLKRAEAMKVYVAEAHPELASVVKLRAEGEAWDDLRDLVAADWTMSETSREKILGILDSGIGVDSKKAGLKVLPEYRHLLDDVYPSLRVSSIVIVFNRIVRVMQGLEPLFFDDVEIEEPVFDIPEDVIVMKEDNLYVPFMTVGKQKKNKRLAQYDTTRKPWGAIKTNLLYDIAATPNVSVEFPMAKGRLSMGLNYEFPWWVWENNSRAWQILHLEGFARLWMGPKTRQNAMTGPYVGLVGGAGYYDIEPHHYGWQGEAVNAGVELGYAWALGKEKRWRLETGVGAGWMATKYRRYRGTSDDQHLIRQYNGRYQWIGPVKAEIGLSYVLFTKKKEGSR